MSVPVVYLHEARDDIEAARRSYEEQQEGLGERFAEAVQAVVSYIQDFPQAYGVYRRRLRAAPLKRFSYVVYYRERDLDVLIVAVQHGRRSFRSWSRRL